MYLRYWNLIRNYFESKFMKEIKSEEEDKEGVKQT